MAVLQPRVTTTTVLAGAATFTSPVQRSGAATKVAVLIFASHAGTCFVEQSIDGTNWDLVPAGQAVVATTGIGFEVELFSPIWRIRYLNGATLQTTFRLQACAKAL